MNEFFFSVVFHFGNQGRFERTRDGVHKTAKTGEAAYFELKEKLDKEHSELGSFIQTQFIAFNKIN